MSSTGGFVPDQLPILSRGKHRNPRKGACFMEMASYLAGERWSDHPACTHPLLAAVARNVNDYISDAARPRLAEHIPSVIGLTSDDLRVDARLALLCARTALPVVSAERQRLMAVSIIVSERVLADLDGRPVGSLDEASRRALGQAPDAEQWARRFTSQLRISPSGFRRRGAPGIVTCAVEGIAQACIADPDEMLRDLLGAAIAECAACVNRQPAVTIDTTTWAAACRLTDAARR